MAGQGQAGIRLNGVQRFWSWSRRAGGSGWGGGWVKTDLKGCSFLCLATRFRSGLVGCSGSQGWGGERPVVLVVTESRVSPVWTRIKGLKTSGLVQLAYTWKHAAVGVPTSPGSLLTPGRVTEHRHCCQALSSRSRGVGWMRRCGSQNAATTVELFSVLFFYYYNSKALNLFYLSSPENFEKQEVELCRYNQQLTLQCRESVNWLVTVAAGILWWGML